MGGVSLKRLTPRLMKSLYKFYKVIIYKVIINQTI